MNKPLIGITLDFETKPTYSAYPWYALRENYAEAVVKAGGTPIMLPHMLSAVSDYSNMIDGLILTGGDFDIDPSYYGENISSERVVIKDKRTKFEMDIFKQVLALNKPIFGICAGEQLMNVAFGGSLIQHIPDSVPNCLEHEQKTEKHLTSHKIKVMQGTLLHSIVGAEEYMVNSTHHQAVKNLGKGLALSAKADDGVTEAIELAGHKFCIGVQWHPEYHSTQYDEKLFKAFVSACCE